MLDSGRYIQHVSVMILYLASRVLQFLQRSVDELPELFEPFGYDSQDAWDLYEENTVLDLIFRIFWSIFWDFPAN